MCNSSGVFGVPQVGDENGDKVVRNDFVNGLVMEGRRLNTMREKKQNEALYMRMRKFARIMMAAVILGSLAFLVSVVFSGDSAVMRYCKIAGGISVAIFFVAWFKHDHIHNKHMKGQGP